MKSKMQALSGRLFDRLKRSVLRLMVRLRRMMPTNRTDYARLMMTVFFVSLALFFMVRPADRYTFTLDNARSDGCSFGRTIADAPTIHTAMLASYYISTASEPIPDNDTSRTWGDCPYAKQKLKTYAVDLWLLAAAAAFSGRLHSLYRRTK